MADRKGQEETYAARRQRLLGATATDGFVVFDLDRTMPAHIDHVSLLYLTGYTGEGALLVLPDEEILMTDSRYVEQAQREAPSLTIEHVEGDYLADIASRVNERGISRLGYAAWRMTDYVARRLDEATDAAFIAARDPVADLRLIKDDVELASLRRAIDIAEGALVETVAGARAGMTEQELADELGAAMRRRGSERASFAGTVAFGANASLPHYRPGMIPCALKEGDFVLIDFGGVIDGYVSDITRTYVFGEPTDKQREIYDLVLRSVEAGIAAIRDGAKASEPHRLASEVIEASPYAEHVFLSPLGHGVGLEVHEMPKMGPGFDEPLRAGMVSTVEPGIYIPEVGGVRIEETVLVTEHGCEVLNTIPRDRLIRIP